MDKHFHLLSVFTQPFPSNINMLICLTESRDSNSDRCSDDLTTKKIKDRSYCIAMKGTKGNDCEKYVHFAVCSSRVCWSASYGLCVQILYRTSAANEPLKFANSSPHFSFFFFFCHNHPVRGMFGT